MNKIDCGRRTLFADHIVHFFIPHGQIKNQSINNTEPINLFNNFVAQLAIRETHRIKPDIRAIIYYFIMRTNFF